MKLIGVTGKGGAGKTTFVNLFETKENIGVIHIDDIVNEFKDQKFSIFMNKNNKGQKAKIKPGIKMFLFKNKFLYDMLMKFRAFLIEKEVDRRIQEFENQGKEYVLLDDIYLNYNRRYNELSKVYYIRRPYTKKITALQARDELDKRDLVAGDIIHKKRNYKIDMKDRRIQVINNNYDSLEEYQRFVETLYEERYSPEKTLDDWIRVDTKPNIRPSQMASRLNRVQNKKFKEEI